MFAVELQGQVIARTDTWWDAANFMVHHQLAFFAHGTLFVMLPIATIKQVTRSVRF